jgi:hypothetical protein
MIQIKYSKNKSVIVKVLPFYPILERKACLLEVGAAS